MILGGSGGGTTCGSGLMLSRLRCYAATSTASAFHLLKRGTHFTGYGAAGQLDCHDGTQLFDKADSAHTQNAEIDRFLLRVFSHSGGQRPEDSVAQQDAEKGSYQGRGHLFADGFLGAAQ